MARVFGIPEDMVNELHYHHGNRGRHGNDVINFYQRGPLVPVDQIDMNANFEVEQTTVEMIHRAYHFLRDQRERRVKGHYGRYYNTPDVHAYNKLIQQAMSYGMGAIKLSMINDPGDFHSETTKEVIMTDTKTDDKPVNEAVRLLTNRQATLTDSIKGDRANQKVYADRVKTFKDAADKSQKSLDEVEKALAKLAK